MDIQFCKACLQGETLFKLITFCLKMTFVVCVAADFYNIVGLNVLV